MTLSRKILLRNLALLAGVVLLGGAAVAGLWRLRGHVDVAIDEYAELRLLSASETAALEAEAHLIAAQPDVARAREDLARAIDALGQYLVLQEEAQEGSAGHERREEQKASAAAQSLRAVRVRLDPSLGGAAPPPPADAASLATEVRAAVGHLQDLAREADSLMARTGRRASSSVRETLASVAVTFLLIVASTVVIGILQHRAMIAPLRALTDGVRAVAAGRFAQRLQPAGDREFARLAQEFNRMAGELDDLYRSLEAKVAAKSRELVRSERLASVGFLAAGVAHEINNPLHIISGYAQLSLKRLRNALESAGSANGRLGGGETPSDALRDAEQSLQIIRDESFRCKRITEKLLSLSEPGAGVREHEPVSLTRAARDVAEVVLAHEACRDRKLVLCVDEDRLMTRGSEPEIKQVLLNLVVNALEAVEPGRGRVTIESARNNGWVELRITDNGRGMTPDVLEHVFEPFFSDKPGGPESSGRRGLGLGLSISHAIVEGHGGRLRAESPGPDGVGSRFILELPAERGESSSVAVGRG